MRAETKLRGRDRVYKRFGVKLPRLNNWMYVYLCVCRKARNQDNLVRFLA